jgi:HAD superfamily hydrolase (TIGR01549 family)
MKGVIFDLDQTIVDSSISEAFRNSRNWNKVFDLIPHFILYNGIREFIQELKLSQFKIAIVTTSPSNYAERVLEHFDISYDSKVCYHDVSKRKPYPDQYLKAIKELGLSLANTYTLGDRSIDIQAAHSANIISCACYWGTKERELLDQSKPNLKFNSVNEARAYFSSL